MRPVTRRDALHRTGVGLAATLAGCSGGGDPDDGSGNDDSSDTDPTSTPTEAPARTTDTPMETPELSVDPADLSGVVHPETDPETVPEPLECEEDEFERHYAGFDDDELDWGAVREDGTPTFALRVDGLAFERGDEVRVTLTNVRSEELGTGNEHKYNLQAYTADGWRDVRGWADGMALPYTDELVGHEPESGFEWTLTLTGEGVLDGHPHEDDLVTCPGLPAGRYRFAYWGVDGAVAVAFDLVG